MSEQQIQLVSQEEFLRQVDTQRPEDVSVETYHKAALAVYQLITEWLINQTIDADTFDRKQESLQNKYLWLEEMYGATPYMFSTAFIHIAKGEKLEIREVRSGWSSYKR